MQWNEVRQLYPDQWVHLQAMQSHIHGDQKIVDDVAVIRNIADDREATKLLLKCSGDFFVLPYFKTTDCHECDSKTIISRA